MSTLPRKIIFLVLFALVHFVLCRIEELLLMRRGWDWSRVVDPFSVRVRALKAVLSRRGIGIENGLERKDLSELVYSSGRLTEAEVAQAVHADEIASRTKDEEEEPSVTDFSGLAHFDELVEDCKDSAWLVEVRQHGQAAIAPATWRRLAHYLRTFDIRLGRVDCFKRRTLCHRKALQRSGLLLAMPKGRHRMKDSVAYSWFTRKPDQQRVLRWLEEALASRVPVLDGGLGALQTLWNSTEPGGADSSGDFILGLDLDRLRDVPLLLSSLSVRFTGRVRFWRVNATEGRSLFGNRSEGPGHRRHPAGFYLVSGRGRRVYKYGARPDWSEATTFEALQLFLKMNYPEANDVFVGLFFAVCMLALLSLSMKSRGGFIYRVLSCLWSFCFYVFLFFVLYPPLVHLLSHRSMRGCRAALLAACQTMARTVLGGILRRDCLAERYNVWRLSMLFLVYLGVVAVVESRFSDDEEESEESNADGEATQRRAPPPYDPEAARMDHMVNYLYSSLWLPPNDLEKDYVNRLPVWNFRSPTPIVVDREAGSDTDARHDAELGWPIGAIYSRQCSVCLIDYRPNTALCSLPCGHVFHDGCVKQWLQQPEKDSCPNCRWPAFKPK